MVDTLQKITFRNMSTESLHSSTASSFTGDIDSYLDKIGSKAPQSWRKPRSRMYDYNRTLGNEYYQVNVTRHKSGD